MKNENVNFFCCKSVVEFKIHVKKGVYCKNTLNIAYL